VGGFALVSLGGAWKRQQKLGTTNLFVLRPATSPSRRLCTWTRWKGTRALDMEHKPSSTWRYRFVFSVFGVDVCSTRRRRRRECRRQFQLRLSRVF